jgi:hypothetical protein
MPPPGSVRDASHRGDERPALVDGPAEVLAQAQATETGHGVTMSHDGWRRTHGLTHLRNLTLEDGGTLLRGEDALAAFTPEDRAVARRPTDACPTTPACATRSGFTCTRRCAQASIDLGGTAVSLALPSGETWVFRHSCAAELSLKPSVYFDSRRLTPRATKQIVLSARMKGYGVVLGWSLARPIAFMPANRLPVVRPGPTTDPSKRPARAFARGPCPPCLPTPPALAPIRRALISVSDKTGLVDFAKALADRGVELLSTGGTAATLRDAGLTVTDVADVTGFPEMMDGRVKTLHPKVHGGLLALRDKPDHVAAMETHGIGAIDLLVVNLYPFEETVAGGADYATAIENIDIGGPAMIRAAAKNHAHVAVVVDPEDYGRSSRRSTPMTAARPTPCARRWR